MSETPKAPTILFFDGYCNLCNTLIDFLIKRDSKGKIHFAPLSGAAAQKYLDESLRKKVDSVVLIYNEHIYLRSTAGILALYLLGGLWKSVLIFFIFPKFMRDPVYNLIAKKRYSWFGKRETCRLPSDAEKQLFLE